MVVAFSAVQGESEEGSSKCTCYFIEIVLAFHLRDHVVRFPLSQAVESGCDGSFNPHLQFITRDLFADELIEGSVFVKGSNYIITVAPEGWSITINGETIGLGIAHYIKPMAGPSLPIAGRSEVAIDHLWIGSR